MAKPILGDPGADSRGEKQLKTGEIVESERSQDGWESPWEDTI